MNFEVKRSIVIEKPVEDVWNLLWDGSADTFGEGIAKILSNVKATNKVLTDGQFQVNGISGRELSMVDGSFYTEMLRRVDEENRILSYDISGIPFGIVPTGTWTVSNAKDDANKTELSVTDVATLSYWPPQFLAYPVFTLMLPGVFDAMLADIKHYAETGEPSPAKVEAINKCASKKK
uniref:SRPBCC family protein n=1 Tax=Minutocellus polymorphus TaxID=265543 RepID=A0A7S0ARK6_9STRA|mmetsp:Transcript_18825/g.31215  ORF Transcript_18825/g.31215 Transcript_18825/m.31215 type:complete len:178 (+) Transcript_18825:33-566(+)